MSQNFDPLDTRKKYAYAAFTIALGATVLAMLVSWYFTWRAENHAADLGRALASQVATECKDKNSTSPVCQNAETIEKNTTSSVQKLIGPVGPQGPAGPPGPQGPPGLNGTNGANGKSGKNGLNGTNGVDGTNGKNGVDGSQGPAGPAGPTGPQGPAGQDGTNGKDGVGITNVSCTGGTPGQPMTMTFTYSDGTTQTVTCQ